MLCAIQFRVILWEPIQSCGYVMAGSGGSPVPGTGEVLTSNHIGDSRSEGAHGKLICVSGVPLDGVLVNA